MYQCNGWQPLSRALALCAALGAVSGCAMAGSASATAPNAMARGGDATGPRIALNAALGDHVAEAASEMVQKLLGGAIGPISDALQKTVASRATEAAVGQAQQNGKGDSLTPENRAKIDQYIQQMLLDRARGAAPPDGGAAPAVTTATGGAGAAQPAAR